MSYWYSLLIPYLNSIIAFSAIITTKKNILTIEKYKKLCYIQFTDGNPFP
ncbi:MAG: hypothetical protein ACK5LT_01425 [Lachnospirales bacterium]